MSIRRVVPDLTSVSFDRSRRFYHDFLGFDVGMDMGWVMTFVSPTNSTAQITVVREDSTAPVRPDITVEVSDVDRLYEKATELGYELVHPLTDEPWGVRRFFVKDPDGVIINLMTHIEMVDPEG